MARQQRKPSTGFLTKLDSQWISGIVLVVVLVAGILLVTFNRKPDTAGPTNTDQDSNAATSVSVQLPKTPVSVSTEQLRQEGDQVIAELLAQYPSAAAPRKIAARYAQDTRRFSEAGSHWQEVLKFEPQSLEAHAALAGLAIKNGQPQEAVDRLLPRLRPQSPHPQVYLQIIRGLQQAGQLDRAGQISAAAIEAFPQDSDLLQAAAEVNTQSGALEVAKEQFQKALELNPSNPSIHFRLAGVYRRLGMNELADEHQEKSKSLRPEVEVGEEAFELEYDRSLRDIVSVAMARSADYYFDQNDGASAEKLALRAASIYPQGVVAYQVLSRVYYGQGQYANAVVVHKRLTEIEPANPVNFVNLSKLAFMAGDAATGRSALLTARQMAPDSALVASALAAYHLENGSFQEARSMAEESIRLKPTVTAYRVLSAACAKLSDVEGQKAAESAALQLMKSISSNTDPQAD
ncbi:tetratricopeptide repeat protein [Bremerella sp.]|uniref:tetratricopeptide repeat protein n=1 Tax=Bremerella sp. TaxID=2795602 RepID=UPI00391A9F5A